MTPEERFASNLRLLREGRELSQEDLAWRAKIHRSQISPIENGQCSPQFLTLIRLAGALGVTLNDLATGITWTPAEFQPGSFGVGDGVDQLSESANVPELRAGL